MTTIILAVIGIILALFAVFLAYANYRRQLAFHKAWKRQYNELQTELDRLRNFLNV